MIESKPELYKNLSSVAYIVV